MPFSYRDLTVARGATGRGDLLVGHLADGRPLSLPLHVVHGARPGPTLLLLGVVHGEEIFAVDVIRGLLESLDAAALRGTVLAVPVCNPPALAARTRNTPLDMLDMNRHFPGRADGWLSERMAAEVGRLVDCADCLIHVDGGTADRVIHYVFLKEGDGAGARTSERLSRAFGMKTLYRGPHTPGSVTAYAAERGVPSVLAMIGGAMLYTDPRYLSRAVQGVTNVLRELDMVDGAAPIPTEHQPMTRRELMRVPVGGIFHAAVGMEAIDRPVPKGTILGTILDPYTLEEVAVMTAPFDRSVLLQMRVLPAAVQPGDYAYIVGDYYAAEPMEPIA